MGLQPCRRTQSREALDRKGSAPAACYNGAMSAGEIAPMMQDLAEQAARLGREFKINLDYSEGSLEEVERLLARFHDEISSSGAGKLDEMSKIWGGYLGEVVRRRFGGEWSIEKYPAGDF